MWLRRVLVAACGIFRCGVWALWLWCADSGAHGLSCPTACAGLSSPTRDRTHVACVRRQILNHWAAREVPKPLTL